ncbi:MAG TPA: GAF domain-containing protein [Anaerolineae bacterium]|nr:GAF domain-containing protein [Anaerolineae bacterium]
MPVPESDEEQIRFQAQLLNAVEQAILAVDLTGRIIFWNRFAETLYGWTEGEVQGRNIAEVLAAPLLMEAARANMGQLRRGESWSGEFLVQRRDGATFTAQVSASLIQNERRTLISIISISRDSTDQQLQEANRLLAEVGALLTNVVDYEAPLTTLAQLAVPQLADWCAVHLLQADGSITQVALAPAETATLQAAYDWLQHYLPHDDADGLPAVLRSGQPKLIADVPSDRWAAAIRSYMIVPLIVHPKTLGAITFVAAESGRRFDLNALALAENLVSHIALYLDKARLYRESQRLNAELEQHVSERTAELRAAVAQLSQSEVMIQTLFRISKQLNATLEVDTILDELAQEAIRMVNGESGFAGLRTADGMTARKYFRQGTASPFEYTWPSGQGIPGWVLKHKVPYGTSDAANDPMMQHALAINTDVRSIICTPILSSFGEVLGYFDIRNKQDAEGFTVADQDLLMALAPAASIAIQNALAYQQRLSAEAELQESYERLRALAANLELVREEERTQIARELHDQLGQALTAMKFDLAWLTDRLVNKDAALGHKAKAVTAQMDTMIKTVRRIATELRPGMLDDLGLAASIEWQARDFEKRTGIVCEVSVSSPDLPLPRAQSLALFRIFQEALTNVARHAGAQLIEVRLAATPEALTLQVHDDGRGIQTGEIAGLHSLGLLGMRERAQRLGGTFDIQGVPGDGTIVTVSIPLKPNE